MFTIRKVTVIGANGTMGSNIAGIFASFGEAEVYLISRTIEKSKNAIKKIYHSVRSESIKDKLYPCDFSQLEKCIDKSDLIFEACKEDWDVKRIIHSQIAMILDNINYDVKERKIICSGTSGLSITTLAELYPKRYQPYVVGMHFFNPPYHMTLCELISTQYINKTIFKELKKYTILILHRTIVEVKDSPAFLGNRIGFQFINEALQAAEYYKCEGGIDYIDSILGLFTGRIMRPLITADFVGLDVLKAIVNNLYENTNDYAHDTFHLPAFAERLILEGKLGKKTQEGLYRTVYSDNNKTKMYQVYDIEHDNYREVRNYIFPYAEKMVASLRIGDYKNAFSSLICNKSIEAQICCQFLLKYILYSLSTANEVADNISAAEDVMATGFNWCPPFALIEVFGGTKNFQKLCNERIDSKILKQLDLNYLLSKIEKSKYDYRRFLYAKS